MKDKFNYKKACNEILRDLSKINLNIRELDKFELAEHIKDEIETIKDELNKIKLISLSDLKKSFNNLMEISCQIQDSLSEIRMVSGDLIKDINKLPEERKKALYYHFGIKEITPEYMGLSDKLNSLLKNSLNTIEKIISKYLDHCKKE